MIATVTEKRRGENFYILHVEWKKSEVGGNARCSLAIVSRYEAKDAVVLYSQYAQRPILGMYAEDIWIFSLHSDASGKASKAASSLIEEAQKHVADKDWIVAGDFYCQIGEVNGNFDKRAGATAAKRRGNNLMELDIQNIDWVVQRTRSTCKTRLSHHPGKNMTTNYSLMSDHPAQKFQIWSTKGG